MGWACIVATLVALNAWWTAQAMSSGSLRTFMDDFEGVVDGSVRNRDGFQL
jgi:hypothetical protein